MIDLPLTRAQEDQFVEALLAEVRTIRLEVKIRNRDEKPVGELTTSTGAVVEGAVQVDADEEISRSLSLTLLDPGHKLAFTPDSPAQGALYADNFVSVKYCVWVPDMEDWVEVPVFWGVLSAFEHNGAQVTIEAQGKESLALAPHLVIQGYTIRKNTRIDDAMRRVLLRLGESRWDVPRLRRKLHSDYVVESGQEPWKVIQGGEDDTGKKRSGLIDRTGDKPHQALYNGKGQFSVKRLRKERVFTFTKRSLVTEPLIRYDVLEARNYVRVRGSRPKGGKHAVTGVAKLRAAHPLSPQRLARNDKPRYMAELVEADNLKTSKECENRAEDILDRRVKAALDVSFECLPIPHLEELDTVAADTEEGRIEFRLKSFTIPLTADSMSINFLKPVRQLDRRWEQSKKRRRRRRRNR